MIEPCPLCGSRDLRRYRFTKAGFLDRSDVLETVCQYGDFYRIECNCGCKFDKHQDYLFDKFQDIFGCDGECFTSDLWTLMISEWNRRVKE